MIKIKKRGQVTLFIILAILLVFAIGLLFYYLEPDFIFSRSTEPRFDSCISNSVNEKIKNLALTAGVANPTFVYLYMGKNHTYLCYTDEFYRPCVNQEPLLVSRFERSLAESLLQDFQACYDSSVQDLIDRGFEVSRGRAEFNVSIEPNEIIIKVDAPTTVTIGDTSSTTREYVVRHRTNLYEVLMIAVSLVQFETYYGDSEQQMQMMYYPDVKIEKIRRDDNVKVYIITEKNEKFEYRFAIKSFPWPSGGLF